MNESWIPINQILQLIGLGPCLLLMFFLLVTLRDVRRAVIPLLFLLSLGAGFVEPALPVLLNSLGDKTHTFLLIVQGLLPAAIFLLILQFLRGGIPRFTYWLVLVLPLMGGGALYYIQQYTPGEVCLSAAQIIQCVDSVRMFSLYTVLTGGLILLLVMPELGRAGSVLAGSDPYRQDKFWLIIALVVLAAGQLALELMQIGGTLESGRIVLLNTTIRLAFVFLMFASLFRVFSQQFVLALERIPTAQRLLTSDDRKVAEKIETLLRQQKIYREMGLSRGQLAERLTVSETQLSHIINRHFECNFNTLVNVHRVEEAKDRLQQEPQTSVTVIAFEVGFNSIASFNRVFKDLAGMSPSDWRQQKE